MCIVAVDLYFKKLKVACDCFLVYFYANYVICYFVSYCYFGMLSCLFLNFCGFQGLKQIFYDQENLQF